MVELADHRSAVEAIEADRQQFLADQDDPRAERGALTLPDGTTATRIPGYERWMWDGEFCGRIGLRWQEGTAELPTHVLGHIGYAVVSWKRGRGYATNALAQLLPDARAIGLPHVELATDPNNVASLRVLAANNAQLIGPFELPEVHGGGAALRFRIALTH